MEQTLTINCPEGKKAIYNEYNQTVYFVDIEPIRSKSWEEFCKNHSDVSNNEWCIDCKRGYSEPYGINGVKRTIFNKALLATKEDAEGILALIQLTRLHDEWIGDWKPDWRSITQRKYCILFYAESINITSTCLPHRLLTFPTKEMAREFLNYFRDLINKAKKFI